MTSKREYLEKIRARYGRAGRLHKGRILDEFCHNCGYERKWAIRLLNRRQARVLRRSDPKAQYEGKALREALKDIWFASGQMCGKRLKPAMGIWMPHYPKPLEVVEQQLLLEASASTLDRLLAPLRVRYGGRGMGGTKQGGLLKTQIPIRTDNWDITQPGYVEIDTVAHCGTSLSGNFIWSVIMTDLFSGWTSQRAVRNKGAHGVLTKTQDMETCLPFELLGVDSDNGTEFLNYPLVDYLTKRVKPVAFTRSRAYHKNDNAHIEQKNWTHARQLLGYERLDIPELVPLINDLYSNEWQLLQNGFCPSMKLISKKRIGGKLIRHHDAPQTPLQRRLDWPQLPAEKRQQLTRMAATHNPFELRQKIESKLKIIWREYRRLSLASTPVGLRPPCVPASDPLHYHSVS